MVAALVALCLAGCVDAPRGDEAAAPARLEEKHERPAAVAARPRIVALGDSLTAGYGLDAGDAFPAVLQRRLDARGYAYEVVNMGVSGDTSAGGLRRLNWALDGDVRVLIVALGGNDGLRGLSPDDLRANLEAIIDGAQARRVRVLLCGMEAPPNLGDAYTRAFREVYPRVARERGVTLLPFLLEGIAGDPSLNQADGIHPTAEGARRLADHVWTKLEPLLDESGKGALGAKPPDASGRTAEAAHGSGPGRASGPENR